MSSPGNKNQYFRIAKPVLNKLKLVVWVNCFCYINLYTIGNLCFKRRSEDSSASIASEGRPSQCVLNVSSQAEFARRLEEARGRLVVIDFYAQWCGPCKRIAPEFEQAAAEFPDVVFLKVDIDVLEDIATEYEVSSMPTFVFLKKKKRLDRFSGANMDKVLSLVKKYK